MSEYKDKAIEKIKKESEARPKGQIASAIYMYMVEIIKSFCEQDEEFAQAVVQTDKTLSDCAEKIGADNKGKSYLSDLNVCKAAADFYFCGADVSFVMRVVLNPVETVPAEHPTEEKKSDLALSLDDLLDL